MTQTHTSTITKQTSGGGTHTYFIYDKPIVQDIIKTTAEVDTDIMNKFDSLIGAVKKNNKIITRLVPSLEEIIRGNMSSNMYVRNGWSGL